MLKIDLLYFDGCPSWHEGLENLKKALQVDNLDCEIRTVEISNEEQAEKEKFLGSPSFRLNGVDFWEEKRSRYDLNCRLYPTPQGLQGTPTVEMLRERIRRLLE